MIATENSFSNMSSEKRCEILSHYKRGHIIRSALDFEVLREEALIGNAHLGFTVKKGEIIPTASLTESGKFFLKIERKPLLSRVCSHMTRKAIGKVVKLLERE